MLCLLPMHLKQLLIKFDVQTSISSFNCLPFLLCSALVTEKSGVPRLPPSNHAGLSNSNLGSEFLTSVVKKNMQLEKELDNIKIKHARAVDDCEEAYDKIKNLESQLQKMIKQEKDDTNIVIERLKHEVNN